MGRIQWHRGPHVSRAPGPDILPGFFSGRQAGAHGEPRRDGPLVGCPERQRTPHVLGTFPASNVRGVLTRRQASAHGDSPGQGQPRGAPGVAQGSSPAKARLWDVATGRETQTFSERVNDVDSAAFLPDGKQVLMEGNGVTQLFDVASGKADRAFPEGAQSAALSPNGKLLLTGNGPVARLWAVESTRNSALDGHTAHELRTFTGLARPVGAVAFSPDARRVFTVSANQGDLLQMVLSANQGKVTRQMVHVWDAAAAKVISSFSLSVKEGTSVTFSPNGKYLVTDSPVSPLTPVQPVPGKRFASGLSSTGREIRLWDPATGKEIPAFLAAKPITCVAFAPSGNQVLVVTNGNSARLWDASSGKEIRTFDLTMPEEGLPTTLSVYSLAFSADGERVLMVGLAGPRRPGRQAPGRSGCPVCVRPSGRVECGQRRKDQDGVPTRTDAAGRKKRDDQHLGSGPRPDDRFARRQAGSHERL